MRYLAVVLASVLLAAVAAVGISAVGPEEVKAANTVSVRACTGGTVTLSNAEARMLRLHNKRRASRGLSRLCVHPALQRAARAHSQDMIQRDYFKHGDVGARLRHFGYNWRTYGENIAWGTGSRGAADPIFKGWMNSPAHRNNILNRGFREVGIGAARGNYKGSTNTTMWTADFGTRR